MFFFAWFHGQCKNCYYQFGPGFFGEFIFQLMFLPAVGENPNPHEGVPCSFHYSLCSMELTDVLMDTPGGNNFQTLHLHRNVRWFNISANFWWSFSYCLHWCADLHYTQVISPCSLNKCRHKTLQLYFTAFFYQFFIYLLVYFCNTVINNLQNYSIFL